MKADDIKFRHMTMLTGSTAHSKRNGDIQLCVFIPATVGNIVRDDFLEMPGTAVDV